MTPVTVTTACSLRSRCQLLGKACFPASLIATTVVVPSTSTPWKMADTVRQRKSQARPDFSARPTVLTPLKGRIHSDPTDKPQIDGSPVPPKLGSLTLSWHEIPPWQQDNEYIITGYRRCSTFSVC